MSQVNRVISLTMSENLLGGLMMAVSLANAILLIWLGLTVLLNSERRTWGMWLAGGSLLTGGAFFLIQSAVAGRGPLSVVLAVHVQWPLGWFIGLLLPLAWYIVMLWHFGYSRAPDSSLRRAHRIWLPIALTLGVVVAVLAALAFRYPFTWNGQANPPSTQFRIAGLPAVAIAYPLYIILCIVLSIAVLRRPGASARAMGETARHRAQPWLMATTIGLLLASLVLGGVMLTIAGGYTMFIRVTELGALTTGAVVGALVVSFLILISVIFLGQAVVAYDIFTGNTLPRHGLRRHWYAALALALLYGGVIGRGVIAGGPTALTLMLATLLIAVLFALLSWRSYVERDRYMDHLRPFVASARVYDALIEHGDQAIDAATPFHALCAEVLDAESAYLATVGPLSSLAGPPLVYPEGAKAPADIAGLAETLTSPEALFVPVDPADNAGARWVVPLWSERGLIGMLLLGPKTGDRLYTQEEMEIARASGERLIDTVACARMAQRLMALQRQWLADSRVSGRHARRVLHDDILPRIHTAMLSLGSSSDDAAGGAVEQLAAAHHGLSDLLRELPTAGTLLLAELGLMGALKRSIEDEFSQDFTSVTWQISPGADELAADLPSTTAEVLYHATREAIRNAARHGRGPDPDRSLHLTITVCTEPGLDLSIRDDGVGYDSPGASDTGQGVAIHSTMMAVIGGAWASEALPDGGTRVTLTLANPA